MFSAHNQLFSHGTANPTSAQTWQVTPRSGALTRVTQPKVVSVPATSSQAYDSTNYLVSALLPTFLKPASTPQIGHNLVAKLFVRFRPVLNACCSVPLLIACLVSGLTVPKSLHLRGCAPNANFLVNLLLPTNKAGLFSSTPLYRFWLAVREVFFGRLGLVLPLSKHLADG